MPELAAHVATFSDEQTNFGDLLELLDQRPRWQADALCREHPEVTWFPRLGQDGRPAKAVCSSCLVLAECRTWALARGPELEGIWGGLSKRDRATRGAGRAA